MGISVVSTLYTMPAIAATKAREMRIFILGRVLDNRGPLSAFRQKHSTLLR